LSQSAEKKGKKDDSGQRRRRRPKTRAGFQSTQRY
jgi:hypothetical protein